MAVTHAHAAVDRLAALRENAEHRHAAAESLAEKLGNAMESESDRGRARITRQLRAVRRQAADAAVEAERYARRADALRDELRS